MLHAHRTLDSRPRQGSLAPDAQPFVSRGQIHHQRTTDDLADITVGAMIETIRDFAEHRQVRAWDHSTAARVQEEYQTSGYYPIQVNFLWYWGRYTSGAASTSAEITTVGLDRPFGSRMSVMPPCLP